MRTIDLTERFPDFPLYSRLVLNAHAALPEDDESRRQAYLLLGDELARCRSAGADGYEPTWLSAKVLENLYHKYPRRFLTGLIAIAMVALDNAGQRMSLEKASEVVSEFSATTGSAQFLRWQGQAWQKNEKKLTYEKKSLQQIFREYRSVAHICAAEVILADFAKPHHPFETTPEVAEHFLLTALHYQRRLSAASNFSEWNLWHIIASPPPETDGIELLLPSDELLEWLLRPWLTITQRRDAES
jgi:hypothetical protein